VNDDNDSFGKQVRLVVYELCNHKNKVYQGISKEKYTSSKKMRHDTAKSTKCRQGMIVPVQNILNLHRGLTRND